MPKPTTKKKSKLMKRLPPNWGDNLTLDDIEWTIQHFREMIAEYSAMLDNPLCDSHMQRLANTSLPIVRSRVTLWETCRALRVEGKSIMPVLRDAVRG